ncbi:tripartite tricarboxylate transporter TctB family protein [Salibacterium salarium]|uniref:Tripartite tricarboxylate transporter TctB family protein n=1 Tax=Salibacterium salarium TaxID=284579 RepID=A0A3R9WRP9_9BACI|nr:tripartite tricarboxylate transporter TctB family protein [Salibacterium salarium]RSL32182.1 tripartite tricarboxylate transporter TctB family protein [Salibacterium salarium]
MRNKLNVFSISVAVFALSLLFLAIQLPSSAEVSTLIGPRFWPLVLLVALLIFALLLMIENFKSNNKQKKDETDEISNAVEEGSPTNHTESTEGSDLEPTFIEKYRNWLLLLITVLYTILMSFTGYLIATILFSFVCTILLGMRKKLSVVLTTIAGALLMLILFDYLLNIPLP